jgi:hypothetical protein
MKWSCLFLCGILAACGDSRPVREVITFVEANDPAPDLDADWEKVGGGLNLSFTDIDTRYAKSAIPDVQPALSWKGAAWRGERVSAQVLLWSSEAVEQIECAFSPFRSAEARLQPEVAQARFVRYVLTDVFGEGCGHRKPEDFPASLSPDMLDTLSCFDLEARTTRPLWLSFDIPADAQPGIYNGTLTIYARNRQRQALEVSLEVLPHTLPQPADWAFHLDLWQHPSAIARVLGLQTWSEAHWEALEAPMAMLAAAGQKVITATLNKDPWNHQCFDAYEDMIAWTKHPDGSWSYDYTVFDRWVSFMMQLGIRKQINCYSMIPWNNELHYRDAGKGTMVNTQAIPGTPNFEAIWSPFLQDFSRHLREKGWLEITHIAIDERSPEEMKAMLDFLARTTPEIGTALADNHKSYHTFPNLKDVCISFGETFDPQDLASRKARNLVSTAYVCCSHAFPNLFTFSDPAEGAYIGWYTSAAGLDGFLRWAYNSWTENPLTDSRFRTWPAGDTYLIYPHARSSIRFERLREGIQDFEKIRILRQYLQQSPEKLAVLERELAPFSRPEAPDVPCSELLNHAKKVLYELSKDTPSPGF